VYNDVEKETMVEGVTAFIAARRTKETKRSVASTTERN